MIVITLGCTYLKYGIILAKSICIIFLFFVTMKTPSLKIDLHTHSILSHDGGLSEKHYSDIITNNLLNIIAITDHNTLAFAQHMHTLYPKNIIIGEEISSGEGDVIGLYLTQRIHPQLGIKETARQVHNQHGLLLVPHPFEKFRSSVTKNCFEKHLMDIDLIESFNARGRYKRPLHNALDFAKNHSLAHTASSDAHCRKGIPSAYTCISRYPTNKTLVKMIQSGRTVNIYAPLYTYFCPAINRLRHRL